MTKAPRPWVWEYKLIVHPNVEGSGTSARSTGDYRYDKLVSPMMRKGQFARHDLDALCARDPLLAAEQRIFDRPRIVVSSQAQQDDNSPDFLET